MYTPDYSIDPQKVPHYFDLEKGQLIVGESAHVEALDGGANPAAIHSLGVLLTDQTVEIDPVNYEQLDVDNWRIDKYRKYGRWLHLAVTAPEEIYTNLTEVVLERAYHLGLGPYPKRIVSKSRFGSLPGFYEQIGGVTPKYARGQYDRWSHDQFVDYVEQTFLRKPKNQNIGAALQAKGAAKEGPSPRIIRRLAGNILPLLAERGYPNIIDWEKSDYPSWGAAFMLKNDGERPKKYQLDYLSQKKRGPSTRTIYNHYDSLTDYQSETKDEYVRRLAGIEQRLEAHMQSFRATHRGSVVLQSVMQARHTPAWLGLRMGAQFILLDALRIPGMSRDKNEALATLVRQREYQNAVLRIMPGASLSYLHQVAAKLGVEEDIWPKHNPEYLHIPIGIKLPWAS